MTGGALHRGLIVAVGLALLGPAPLVPWATAKSFQFSRVVVEATVGPDGSLRIGEARTYEFSGSFSWASYRLPLAGASRIREIRIGDDRGPFTRAGSVRRGTYTVTEDGDAIEIRWGFSATDESRTFTIAYVLDDVVTVYDDVAELYWKFIGTGWDRPSADVRVTVSLPGAVPAERIRAWGHGPLHGDVRPVAGGAVLTVRDLPPATMVEGRIVFPKEVVPQARQRRAGLGLPRIQQEEAAWAAQANRARLVQRVLLTVLPALPVLALGVLLYLYLRFGREPEPAVPEGYYRELPGSYSPAEMGALWRFGSVQPADFSATVLDLVRRGFLRVETTPGQGWFAGDTYTLTRTAKVPGRLPFETKALEMLFGRADGEGMQLTLGRRNGLPAEVTRRIGKGFPDWKRAVSREVEGHAFFDPSSQRVSTLALVLGLLVVAGGVYTLVQMESLTGLGGVLAGAVLAGGSGSLRRRSQRGADDLRRWQGFRRFLLDFSEMPRMELPSVALWEHYLVYAVPLGVADRVIRQLRDLYPAEALASAPGLRAWTGSAGSPGRGGNPLAALSGFTTALSAATSSATSSSGSGGGFSGGGGGGGGGSGGSAG